MIRAFIICFIYLVISLRNSRPIRSDFFLNPSSFTLCKCYLIRLYFKNGLPTQWNNQYLGPVDLAQSYQLFSSVDGDWEEKKRKKERRWKRRRRGKMSFRERTVSFTANIFPNVIYFISTVHYRTTLIKTKWQPLFSILPFKLNCSSMKGMMGSNDGLSLHNFTMDAQT